MKAKQLFESSRVPSFFPKNEDTWVRCNDGSILVRWMGSRWLVLARNQRTIYSDDRDLRGIVLGLVDVLGGLKW